MSATGERILILDDEQDALNSCRLILHQAGFSQVVCCTSSAEAFSALKGDAPSLILLDLMLNQEFGLRLIPGFLEHFPDAPIVMITGNQEADMAVACMKAGAHDYLVKPLDADRLVTTVRQVHAWRHVLRENERLKQGLLTGQPNRRDAFSEIITTDARMMNLFAYVEIIADSPKPVLITGESGTGKELLARALHQAGVRADHPMITVNVAGLDDQVFSDTLFGHVRGAYTGAHDARPGLIEKAEEGTLLLDEIGDLAAESQIKLLRLLQEGEYRALGSDSPRICRARIVAMTNQNLEERVQQGLFRSDLYYRLRVHHVQLPPLRERPGDIPLLIRHFIRRAADTLKCPQASVEPEAQGWLLQQRYPGNARELEAMLFDAVTRYLSTPIPCSYFEQRYASVSGVPHPARSAVFSSSSGAHDYSDWTVLPTFQQARQLLIEEALNRTGGNQSAAARMLGVTPQAMNKHLNGKTHTAKSIK